MLTQRISIKGTHVKVERIELFQVAPRWLLCKITAEGGYTGWGEPIVEGKAATVAACVEEMSDFVIGHDARNIEDLFQVLYRGGFYRGGTIEMSAISGIEPPGRPLRRGQESEKSLSSLLSLHTNSKYNNFDVSTKDGGREEIEKCLVFRGFFLNSERTTFPIAVGSLLIVWPCVYMARQGVCGARTK